MRRYQCNVSNKAGYLVINLTLEIFLKSRNEVQEPRHLDPLYQYSGETIAGVVFGSLVVFFLLFLFVIVIRYRDSMTPPSFQPFSCFSKCLLDDADDQHGGHRYHDQQTGDPANNKIGIIENPASGVSEERTNALSGISNNSKYGSFDVFSMMTANNRKSISSQEQQQDIDSGHEEGSFESRVSIVTGASNLMFNAVIREDRDDHQSRMQSNDHETTDDGRRRDSVPASEQRDASLQRPRVRQAVVLGKRQERIAKEWMERKGKQFAGR